jgi:hypothetical protein
LRAAHQIARSYLTIIDRLPEAVEQVLAATKAA